jgi:hypothetical protein
MRRRHRKRSAARYRWRDAGAHVPRTQSRLGRPPQIQGTTMVRVPSMTVVEMLNTSRLCVGRPQVCYLLQTVRPAKSRRWAQ